MTEPTYLKCPTCGVTPTAFDERQHTDTCPAAIREHIIGLLEELTAACEGFWDDAPIEEGPERDRAIFRVSAATRQARQWLGGTLDQLTRPPRKAPPND